MAFGCPRCGTVSQSTRDEAEGYCANCHDVTGGEPVAMGLLPHLTVFELRDLLSMVVPRSPLATAIHEAILHASSHHHRDALSQLGTLRRHLETMTLRVIPGTPAMNGHRMFDKILSVVEQFVRDHARLQKRFGDVDPDDTIDLRALLRPLAHGPLLCPHQAYRDDRAGVFVLRCRLCPATVETTATGLPTDDLVLPPWVIGEAPAPAEG